MKLDLAIAIGLIAGLLLGLLASVTESRPLIAVAEGVAPLGTAFVRLLRMVVVPLVATTVFVGVAGMASLKKLGRVGVVTLAFFAAATIVSILIGMGMMRLLLPLAGAAPEAPSVAAEDVPAIPGPMDFLINLIPSSPVQAAADGALLPLMVFTILFAAAVGTLPEQTRRPLHELVQSAADALIKLVHWVLWTAPIGVFALAAPLMARSGVSLLRGLGVFVLAVIIGLIIFVVAVYLPVVKVLGGVRPQEFLKACIGPQLIAFSSTSSAAAVPAMFDAALKQLRLSPSVVSLVIPLGAAIGRAGSALFQGTALIFLAWLFGIEIQLGALAGAVLATGLVSITVAAVPSASVITLAPALGAVGIPTSGLAILLGVDRIPDMFRTAVNVTGHMAAATVVDRLVGATAEPEG